MDHLDIRPFGTLPDGRQVELITLRKGKLTCELLTYGGALRSLTVPDRAGREVDVLLGLPTLEDYLVQDKFLGALIGRYANRIGGSRFVLNGKEYPLRANDGKNHLHGGPVGFDKQVWTVAEGETDFVTLTLHSPDGQEGYPGDLDVSVTYRLTEDGITLDYRARSSADTLCNLTNHAYFNLSGHQSGPVTGQGIQIYAQSYTPTDAGSIPTGEIAPVEGTPMDLRFGRAIGERVDEDFDQLTMAGGYDHNYVVDGPAGVLRPAARAWSQDTGITMEVLTTQPGIQFYSGNYLDGCPAGKGGAPYAKRWAFCLETQVFPDAPNQPQFPSALQAKGEEYHHTTVYRFGRLP